jgi:uncharacterized protein YoxC
MLMLVEICAVVASLAVVVIAVVAVRAMRRVEQAANQVSRLAPEIQQWVGQASALTLETREAVASVRGVIAPMRHVADRFETLGERTARLADAVLGEVEAPLSTAVSVARGLRSATAFFMGRSANRFTHGRSATNGGSDGE